MTCYSECYAYCDLRVTGYELSIALVPEGSGFLVSPGVRSGSMASIPRPPFLGPWAWINVADHLFLAPDGLNEKTNQF